MAVFLDRDGTIGGDGGSVHPFEFTLYPYSAKAIRQLNEHGLKVFLFTNQSRIGRGFFTEQTFLDGWKRIEKELKTHHAYIDGIYYCPHSPDANCDCRKPQPTLLEKAKLEHDINLTRSYIIGDRMSDMEAADKVGAYKILVKTGRGMKTLELYSDKSGELPTIDYVADNILHAVHWILDLAKVDT